jgi:hypothetical protein
MFAERQGYRTMGAKALICNRPVLHPLGAAGCSGIDHLENIDNEKAFKKPTEAIPGRQRRSPQHLYHQNHLRILR